MAGAPSAPPPSRRERLLSAIARRCERPLERLLASGPLRGRLHERALRAWRATDEPLILCLGNINRSPFAAELARRRPGSKAHSAGFYAQAGRPSPPLTLAAAREYGVDLGAHRSRTLEQAVGSGEPTIFMFDLENLARLAARRPRALARAHFIGSLSVAGGILIADPHGRPPAVLERVLGEIAAAIESADAGRDGAAERA